MMRIFVARSAFVPAAWCDALDEPGHIRQLDVVIAAPVKAAAVEVLTLCGYSRPELRVAGSARDVAALDAAGLIVPTRPLVYHAAVDGRAIAYVGIDGAPVVIAHWRYDRKTAQMRIERLRPPRQPRDTGT
jgi:hypothetical protein